MNSSFETTSKYFFRIAGVVTAAAGLPIMVSPVAGFRLALGLNYFDQSPQVSPVIGHWGIMLVGIGVLLFLSGTNKQIRKSTAIYSTLEKGYIVSAAAYCFLIGAPYARNYLVAMIADSSMMVGGIWYLLTSRKLKQA